MYRCVRRNGVAIGGSSWYRKRSFWKEYTEILAKEFSKVNAKPQKQKNDENPPEGDPFFFGNCVKKPIDNRRL